MGEPGRLLVVGSGLIGSSVGLAATAAGYDVWIDDRDPERLAVAVSVGAGRARDADLAGVDLALAAVPPAAVAGVVDDLCAAGIATTITHVASVQLEPQVEVDALRPRLTTFVGSHPIAGRERSGAHHATADLFEQRPWVICPTVHSAPGSVTAVTDLAVSCGAAVTVMPAAEHDLLLAQLSHTPQLVASALAGSLLGLDRDQVALAGSGLRDTSRLADGDAELWAEIIAANRAAVASALRGVTGPLVALAELLETEGPEATASAVGALVASGRQGRDLLAGKHGQAAVRWAKIAVIVPDQPGELARLLVDAAGAEVNVEDIRVDHSPGQPLGIVELDVSPAEANRLRRGLEERGWTATASTPLPD